jgi:hypothetical protein
MGRVMVNKELLKQLFLVKLIRGGKITSVVKEILAAQMKVKGHSQ